MRERAVLVPVKGFNDAKARLAPALPAHERAALARRLATRVVGAAAPVRVAVACDDDDVAAWARSLGADVVSTAGLDLNGSVARGVEALAASGAEQVAVVHGDLPYVRPYAWLFRFPGVTIVPDRHDDGTNALCLPVGAGFEVAYGPNSFSRHLAEARRLGLAVRIVRVADLAWDVDVPADLPPPS